jgi:Rod binding domain-containing protein
MSDTVAGAGSFYDFSGLRQLSSSSASGKTDMRAAAARAASEFETAFVQMMLQSMKQASEPLKSDLFADESTDYFEDMFINEMAHYIATRQSMGLGKWIDASLDAQQVK